MLARMYGCGGVRVFTYVGARVYSEYMARRLPPQCFTSLSQALFLYSELPVLASLAQRDLTSAAPARRLHVFMWVPGVWTPILLLAQQALYPRSHLSRPSHVVHRLRSTVSFFLEKGYR